MTIKEHIEHHFNKPRDKQREIGKFHASEIWSIYKGYTNPTNFFKQKPADKQGMKNMALGVALEDWLNKVLTEEGVEFVDQERFELEVAPGVWISGKTDFSFPDHILETKCPHDLVKGIPDKWRFQMECYHRASGKPVYLGVFDKSNETEEIISFYKYEPNDAIWETIKETVTIFNNKLIKKYASTKNLPTM